MNRTKLSEMVAVVTGSSSGIGRATALAFARAGADECRDAGAQVLVAPADVADEAAVEQVAADAIARFGRIDVWVNNAATVLYGRVEEAPSELWKRVLETNLVGTYHGARAAIPWFREQGHGVLVNVSSILGKAGSPYQSAYVASKHGVRALGDCIRQEVHDVPGIDVCTVLPGPVDTPLFRNAANWTGRRVVPPGAPADPRRVAAAILRCAKHPKREVVVGASTRLGLLATRLAPALSERVSARALEHVHFEDDPAPPDPGNLFDPEKGEDAVEGGWREPPTRRLGKAALVAAGAAAAVAAGRRLMDREAA